MSLSIYIQSVLNPIREGIQPGLTALKQGLGETLAITGQVAGSILQQSAIIMANNFAVNLNSLAQAAAASFTQYLANRMSVTLGAPVAPSTSVLMPPKPVDSTPIVQNPKTV